MSPRDIDRFFRTLSQEFPGAATIILTGASAGSLWGHIRPSQDIDFGVQLDDAHPANWERFQAAVDRTVRRTSFQVNYAEDLDRWGGLTLLDYRLHTASYRRIGQLNIRLLDPAYWSIGKLGRYFDLDVDDVVRVFRRQRVPAAAAIRVWGRALRASPRSMAVNQFRLQIEHFLQTYGRAIWGRRFDPADSMRRFHRTAGLRGDMFSQKN